MIDAATLNELFTPEEQTWLADVLPAILDNHNVDPERFLPPEQALGRPPLVDRFRLALGLRTTR